MIAAVAIFGAVCIGAAFVEAALDRWFGLSEIDRLSPRRPRTQRGARTR